MYKNKKIIILSHLLVWVVLFSMPYLMSYGQEPKIARLKAHFWIPLFFSAIMFYLNFFLLIEKFLFQNKMAKYIAVNVLIIAFFLLSRIFIENNYFENLNKNRPDGTAPPIKMFFYIQSLSYLAPLFFSVAIKTTQRWVKTEAERKEAANIKLKSELQHLHYQLQPHFFFNSLNNIYAMVDISPEQAKTSIHSLSKLMRYMLYETNVEFVPLSKEIDFMKKYIDLMKLRVSDKTEVTYHFPTVETGILIAPLLFISLIENAFKHGVSASKESQINIIMAREDNKVLFTIDNDNFPKKTDDKSGSGIGLENVKRRLDLLYPHHHTFEYKIVENRFLVTLEIETT